MVSKRAALARMVLESALLALDELNLVGCQWREGGGSGGLREVFEQVTVFDEQASEPSGS